ncbi:MAG: hypothetical protein ABIO72_01500 [Patescibacteria group bacterium]
MRTKGFTSTQAVTVIAVVLMVVAVGYIVWSSFSTNVPVIDEPTPVACTMEAKICPDGSSVGRTGPKCEFAACPAAPSGNTGSNGNTTSTGAVPPAGDTSTASWKTMTSTTTGITFKYPEQLSTQYISTVDWPPLIQIVDKAFACKAAGSLNARAGITEEKTVNGRTYCITRVAEGAAGSTYTQYAYAFAQSGKTVVLTFTLRSVQCGNFDESQKTACEKEQASFDISPTIDAMVQSAGATS